MEVDGPEVIPKSPSSPQGRQQVRNALHVIIGHHPLPLRAAALPIGLSLGHRADAGEGEERLEAAVGTQHDVRVQPVAHHQAAAGLHGELGGHAVKHEAAGFAHCGGLALGCRLNCLQEAART